jgi:glycosyltransferase involved in cell wall biosynthesis
MSQAVNRPVRIALLHNIISPHVVPLFERLAQQPGVSLKVYFLAETEGNRRWDTSINRAFDYEILPNWAIRMGRNDLFTLFINPTIVQSLLRDRFDVLISVGWDSVAAWSAFAVCKIVRKPFVLWSGSTANEPSWRRSLSLPLVSLMVRNAASWISYGTRASQYLTRLGADPDRVFKAYNTVDVDWYVQESDGLRAQRDAIRASMGLDDHPTVLYVGQLIERKGPRDVIEAHRLLLASMPDARLLIAGYGPLESELRAYVEAEGINGVQFLGHVPIPELPRYYVSADCFTLPSHEEVWGLVLNEAAACGLPLVAAAPAGATADVVVPGYNGFVVPSADPQALAQALRQAIQRSDEMGRASRELIQGMTYEQNVQAIVAAVERARR